MQQPFNYTPGLLRPPVINYQPLRGQKFSGYQPFISQAQSQQQQRQQEQTKRQSDFYEVFQNIDFGENFSKFKDNNGVWVCPKTFFGHKFPQFPFDQAQSSPSTERYASSPSSPISSEQSQSPISSSLQSDQSISPIEQQQQQQQAQKDYQEISKAFEQTDLGDAFMKVRDKDGLWIFPRTFFGNSFPTLPEATPQQQIVSPEATEFPGVSIEKSFHGTPPVFEKSHEQDKIPESIPPVEIPERAEQPEIQILPEQAPLGPKIPDLMPPLELSTHPKFNVPYPLPLDEEIFDESHPMFAPICKTPPPPEPTQTVSPPKEITKEPPKTPEVIQVPPVAVDKKKEKEVPAMIQGIIAEEKKRHIQQDELFEEMWINEKDKIDQGNWIIPKNLFGQL